MDSHCFIERRCTIRRSLMPRREEDMCHAHSGVDARGKLLVWLLGILIVVGLGQFKILYDLKENIVSSSYKFELVNERIKNIGDLITMVADRQIIIEKRVRKLEDFELGHVEMKQ